MSISNDEIAVISKAILVINEVGEEVATELDAIHGKGQWASDEFVPLLDKRVNERYEDLDLDYAERCALAQILLENKEEVYYWKKYAAIEEQKEEEKDEDKLDKLFKSQGILADNISILKRLGLKLHQERPANLADVLSCLDTGNPNNLEDVLSCLDKVDSNNLEDVLIFVEAVLRPYLSYLHGMNPKEEILPLILAQAGKEGLGKVSFTVLQKIIQMLDKLIVENETCEQEMYAVAKKDGVDLKDPMIVNNLDLARKYGKKYALLIGKRIEIALMVGLQPLQDACKEHGRTDAEKQILDGQFDALSAKRYGGKLNNREVPLPIVSLEELVYIEKNLIQSEQKEFNLFWSEFLKELCEKTEYPIYVHPSPRKNTKGVEENPSDYKKRYEQYKIDYQKRCEEYRTEHPNCGDFPIFSLGNATTGEAKKAAYDDYQIQNKKYKQELMGGHKEQFATHPLVVSAKQQRHQQQRHQQQRHQQQRHQQQQRYFALITEYIDHVQTASYSVEDKREKLIIAYQAQVELTGEPIVVKRKKENESVDFLVLQPGEKAVRRNTEKGAKELVEELAKELKNESSLRPVCIATRLKKFKRCIRTNANQLQQNLDSNGLSIFDKLYQAVDFVVSKIAGEKKTLLSAVGIFSSKSYGAALVEAIGAVDAIKISPAA